MFLKKRHVDGVFKGVELMTVPKKKHFPVKFVREGISQGYIDLTGDKLTITGLNAAPTYNVVRVPGRYCLFDGSKLSDDDAVAKPGEQARAYIAEHFAGQESPDPQNPAGYERIGFYDCELVEA